jgi:hypothetical protein
VPRPHSHYHGGPGKAPGFSLRLCKTPGVADEEQRRDVGAERQASDDAVMGAPPGRDPDFQLHGELAEEAKRLATHPREEAHRLSEELTAGEAETTPLIALSVVGIGAALVVAIVLALVFVAIYLS